MGRINLDLSPQRGVPQTDRAVLSSSQDVFRCALGVPSNMDRSLVMCKRGMESPWEGAGSSRGSHSCLIHKSSGSGSCAATENAEENSEATFIKLQVNELALLLFII